MTGISRKGDLNRTGIFIVMLLSTVISSLLQTALSTLLPAIMAEFSISAAQAQWLSTAYSLVMGIIIPATAFLLRRFPTKKLYLAGLLLFLAGTLLCGVARSFPVMLAGRILQALSSGISLSMLQVVVLTIFPKHQQGTAMGIYGIAVSVAPAFAPTLAGILVEHFGWRLIFTGSAALYAVIFAVACFVMKDVLENEKLPFDLPSFLLCGAAFAGITIGVGNVASSPFFSFSVALPLGFGMLCLILFIARQSGSVQPFLNLRVLKNGNCAAGTIISMLLYAALIAGSTLTPMYQQVVHGLSPSVSGMIMMPGSLVMAAVSPLTGHWYDKHGIRSLAIGGTILLILSNVGYCLVNETTAIPLLIALFILRNMAVGCLMMPMVTWGMSTLEKKDTSHGSAILSSLRTISGGVGAALFVGMMSAVSAADGAVISLRGFRIASIGLTALACIQLMVVLLSAKNTHMNQGGKT